MREPKRGDTVLFTWASGPPRFAEITRVNKDGTVDLEVAAPVSMLVTKSPYDETGKAPDSWHWPTQVEERAAAPIAPPKESGGGPPPKE